MTAWRTGVLVDTSIWYAAAASSDLGNARAKSALGIERVASFDSDFAIYRYGPRRDRAFQVIPS